MRRNQHEKYSHPCTPCYSAEFLLGAGLQCCGGAFRGRWICAAVACCHRYERIERLCDRQCLEVKKAVMNVIYALIPLSIILLALAIWAFSWAVKSKQFDDLDRSGSDILFDDDDELHKRAIEKERANRSTDD